MDRHDNEQRMQDRGRDRERDQDRDRERRQQYMGYRSEGGREYREGEHQGEGGERGRHEQNFGQGSGYQGGGSAVSGSSYFSRPGESDWRSREGQGQNQGQASGESYGRREGARYSGSEGSFGGSEGGWGREASNYTQGGSYGYGNQYGSEQQGASSQYGQQGKYNYGGSQSDQYGERGQQRDFAGRGNTQAPSSTFGSRQGQSTTYGGGAAAGGPGGYGGGMSSYMSQNSTGQPQGQHTGKGPKGWRRSDDRVREDISERLYYHPDIDASDIEVQVANGEVTLTGTVDERRLKRLVEDVAENVSGVREVHNQLRVRGGFLQSLGLGGQSNREEHASTPSPNVGTTTTKNK